MKTEVNSDNIDAVIVSVSMVINVRAQDHDFKHMGWLESATLTQDLCISMEELAHFVDPNVIFQGVDNNLKRVSKAAFESKDWRKKLALLMAKLRRGEKVDVHSNHLDAR